MCTEGLSGDEVLLIYCCFLPHLAPGQKIDVSLFGSRARGDHKKFSDVDLLIRVTPALSVTALSDIKEDLEEGPLPYLVDLVREAELAETHRPSVERDKIFLFGYP